MSSHNVTHSTGKAPSIGATLFNTSLILGNATLPRNSTHPILRAQSGGSNTTLASGSGYSGSQNKTSSDSHREPVAVGQNPTRQLPPERAVGRNVSRGRHTDGPLSGNSSVVSRPIQPPYNRSQIINGTSIPGNQTQSALLSKNTTTQSVRSATKQSRKNELRQDIREELATYQLERSRRDGNETAGRNLTEIPIRWQANTYGWDPNYCKTGEACIELGNTSLGNGTIECRVKANNKDCTFQQLESQLFSLADGLQLELDMQIPTSGLPKPTNLLGGPFFAELPGTLLPDGRFILGTDWEHAIREEVDLYEVFGRDSSTGYSNLIRFNDQVPFQDDSQVVSGIDPTLPFKIKLAIQPDDNGTYTVSYQYFQDGSLKTSRQEQGVHFDTQHGTIRINAYAVTPGLWNGNQYVKESAYFQIANTQVLGSTRTPAIPGGNPASGGNTAKVVGITIGATLGGLLSLYLLIKNRNEIADLVGLGTGARNQLNAAGRRSVARTTHATPLPMQMNPLHGRLANAPDLNAGNPAFEEPDVPENGRAIAEHQADAAPILPALPQNPPAILVSMDNDIAGDDIHAQSVPVNDQPAPVNAMVPANRKTVPAYTASASYDSPTYREHGIARAFPQSNSGSEARESVAIDITVFESTEDAPIGWEHAVEAEPHHQYTTLYAEQLEMVQHLLNVDMTRPDFDIHATYQNLARAIGALRDPMGTLSEKINYLIDSAYHSLPHTPQSQKILLALGFARVIASEYTTDLEPMGRRLPRFIVVQAVIECLANKKSSLIMRVEAHNMADNLYQRSIFLEVLEEGGYREITFKILMDTFTELAATDGSAISIKQPLKDAVQQALSDSVTSHA